MRRRIPMTRAELSKELAAAERYLKDAKDEYENYPCKTDLIGRALADQVARMRHILICVKHGIPFGVGKNK